MGDDLLPIGRIVLIMFWLCLANEGDIKKHWSQMPQMCCLFFIEGRGGDV